MDPLTIATAAATAITALYQISEKTIVFGRDAKVVDRVLVALRSDISSLMVVLETIKSTLRKPARLLIAQADNNSAFRSIVCASIQECRDSAEQVDQIFASIEEGSVSKSLVARSIRQVRFLKRRDDIKQVQTRLKAQKSNLQLLMQMLNVSLAHYPTAMLKEKISPQISALESLLRRFILASNSVQSSDPVGRSLHDSGEHRPSAEVKPVGDSFLAPSSTSPPIGHGVESHTGNDALTLVPPLSNDGRFEDSDPATDWMPDDSGSDSDDELEGEHILANFEEGRKLYERKLYEEAEKVLRVCLKTAAGVGNRNINVQTIKEIQYFLAQVCFYRQEWNEAMVLLYHLTTDEPTSEVEVLLQIKSLIALAQVCLAKRDFDSAILACKQARSGSKKAQGKSSSGYIESSRLLILTYALIGDLTAANFYNKFLPLGSCFDVDMFCQGIEELEATYKGMCGLGSSDKLTPLSWLQARGSVFCQAAYYNRTNAMKVLFWVGVNVNYVWNPIPNKDDHRTALMSAVDQGNKSSILELMSMGADIHMSINGAPTALQRAMDRRDEDCTNLLLGRGAAQVPFDEGLHERPHIYTAAMKGDYAMIRHPPKNGSDPNGRRMDECDGQTALAGATRNCHEGIVAVLLNAGADPNLVMLDERVNSKGFTALMYATNSDRASIFALLVEAGANTDARAENGTTPFSSPEMKANPTTKSFLEKLARGYVNESRVQSRA